MCPEELGLQDSSRVGGWENAEGQQRGISRSAEGEEVCEVQK